MKRQFVLFSFATSVALLALSPATLWAQTNKSAPAYTLKVSTDKPDAIYHQGDTVTFKIQVLHQQEALPDGEVDWTLSKDGVPPITNGTAKLDHGSATLTGHLDEPGFLLLRATFKDPESKNVSGAAGAAIDPLQIKPSLPPPDDFDEFWSAQKKKLAAIPAKSHLTPVKSPNPTVEVQDVQVDCLSASVSGYYARPKDARPHSLPIILLVQGAGVRSSSLGGATEWASRGFLAMDINAHGITNGQSDAFYAELARTDLNRYQVRGRESRETMYFLGMFLRLVRALDFLTTQPEWNGHTVVVHGSSQGGAQSFAAAGLDPRVTFFAAGVPAMCDHSGMLVGRVSGWPKLVPVGPDSKPDPKVLEAARYYDMMNFATRIRVPGIVTVGFIDTTCPPSSVYAAYNALKTKKVIFNDPPSPHTVTPEAGKAMREAILQHAAENH